jgi:hypothetical protein
MTLTSLLSCMARGHTPKRARQALYAGKQIAFGTKYSKDYEKP